MVACLTIGCSKNSEDNLPSCIQSELDIFMTNNKTCENARVDKYMFQDEEVYIFEEACVTDPSTIVLDANCEEICLLGTIAGNAICNGIYFDDQAIFVENIWQGE